MMILSVIVSAGVIAAPGNPLAKAETGQVQCYRPDAERRTCQSIASFVRRGEGMFDNRAIVAVSKEATLETHTLVVLRQDAVCGYLRVEDMMTGILRLNGAVLSADRAKPVLEKIAQSVGPFAGKEICTRYEATGSKLTAKVSIVGSYRPDQDVEIRWIHPSDGYTVTP